jgi:branched-chain amino acid transport system permease protein
MTRWRPYVLGLLGLAAITFPFLWLTLNPDFTRNTMRVDWSPAHGLQFFSDLSPVFLIAFLIWLGSWTNRRWHWQANLAGIIPATRRDDAARYLKFALMPIVLSGAFFLSASSLGIFTDVAIYMILALGLNITVGMTGLLVLGYAGFYMFGAYVFALGQQFLPFFPWWLAVPFAFALGGGAGYLLGLPCLRLRGDYLAIVTLGFAEAFRELIRNLPITNADQGIILKTHATFGPIVLKSHSSFHPLVLLTKGQVAFIITALLVFLAVFLIERLHRSPIGRAWIAIRENEIAAASIGVPVVQMKLLAFSLSAAIAALAGVICGAKDGFVSPALGEFPQSITILAMVILGGLGNSYGALLGATLLYVVPQYLTLLPSIIQQSPGLSAAIPPFLRDALGNLSDYHLLLFGAVMVIMMLYRPQGLLGSSRRKEEMLHR